MENIINVSLLTRENETENNLINSKISQLAYDDSNNNYSFFQLCFLLLEVALNKIEPNLELKAVRIKTGDNGNSISYIVPINEMALSDNFDISSDVIKKILEAIAFIRNNNTVDLLKLNTDTKVYEKVNSVFLDLNEERKVKK